MRQIVLNQQCVFLAFSSFDDVNYERKFRRIKRKHRKESSPCDTSNCSSVIYQARDAVFHHQMKHWEESWKYDARAAEYFWRTSRCFICWWHTVSSGWYYFSNKTMLEGEIKDSKMISFSSDSKYSVNINFLCIFFMNYLLVWELLLLYSYFTFSDLFLICLICGHLLIHYFCFKAWDVRLGYLSSFLISLPIKFDSIYTI